jgi:hypothetical protein
MPTVEQTVHRRALDRLRTNPSRSNRLKELAAREQCVKHHKACDCEKEAECQVTKD